MPAERPDELRSVHRHQNSNERLPTRERLQRLADHRPERSCAIDGLHRMTGRGRGSEEIAHLDGPIARIDLATNFQARAIGSRCATDSSRSRRIAGRNSTPPEITPIARLSYALSESCRPSWAATLTEPGSTASPPATSNSSARSGVDELHVPLDDVVAGDGAVSRDLDISVQVGRQRPPGGFQPHPVFALGEDPVVVDAVAVHSHPVAVCAVGDSLHDGKGWDRCRSASRRDRSSDDRPW